ncbi:MAG: hypothetical protein KME27_23175 [Lyngbya sp. HA4199-MV5]|jgi:hypothetical protein|nr:hypothetical protein [Lyngbya sp. HA4199-MV5]
MQPINAVLRGLQLALIESVEAYWCENNPNPAYVVPAAQIERITPSGWIATKDGQHLNPLHHTPEQPRKRRYSRKGHASGWIEERQGNKTRKRPSTSYYYRYYNADGRKQQQYVQVHLMDKVSQLINQCCAVETVLQFIHTHSRYSGKLHHTQEPKI